MFSLNEIFDQSEQRTFLNFGERLSRLRLLGSLLGGRIADNWSDAG